MRRLPKILNVLAGFLLLALLEGCGPGKYTPKPIEELYGTWTNNSYSGRIDGTTYLPQKVVIASSGYTVYRFIDDAGRWEVGSEQIDRRWTDSEGNIWYRTHSSHTSDGSGIRVFRPVKV